MNKFQLSIRNKILLVIVFSVLVSSIILASLTLNKFRSVIDSSENNELNSLYNILVAKIETKSNLAQGLATVVANTPAVQLAFYNQDRPALINQTEPLYDRTKTLFATKQFQFHVPPATSFLRVHSVKKFGDDLSKIRQTVIDTNKTQQAMMGLETGVFGLGIRGIVPVSYQEQHIGSVEFGMSFGQEFFDEFKQNYQVDSVFFLNQQGNAKLYANTMTQDLTFTSTQFSSLINQNQKQITQRFTQNNTPYVALFRAINDYSDRPIGVVAIVMDETEIQSQTRSIMLQLGVVLVAILLVATIFALLIGRSITEPIRTAADAMKQIAEGDGDLTQRLDDSKHNEVGALAHAFNLFAAKVQNTVKMAQSLSGDVENASHSLEQLTLNVKNNVKIQFEQSEQVATAAQQMSATIHEVAENAENTASATNNAAHATEEGRIEVLNVAQQINTVAADIANTEEIIASLAGKANNIDNVLLVIQQIAEQTNLLALNAAIEAARAGEQGRGFAVVADEVRNLATRTHTSTLEISQIIEALKTESDNAVQAMQGSINTTQAAVAVANQASQALDAIAQAVQVIDDMNAQIAAASTQQAQTSEDISTNIQKINEGLNHSNQNVEQISQASIELTGQSDRLKQIMAHFKA